jgi:hypothetical protein
MNRHAAIRLIVAKPWTGLSPDIAWDAGEPELLRAMFDVGYFPPNTPP